MKNQYLLLAMLVSVAVVCFAGCSSGQPVFKTVEATNAGSLATQADVVILDVRTPLEFAEGHLPNARNIDFLDVSFIELVKKLDKKKKYLVYCRTDHRSSKAVELMKEQKFKDVTNMLGGISQWRGMVVKF